MYRTFCSITDSEKKVGKKWAQAGFEPVRAFVIAWKSQNLKTSSIVVASGMDSSIVVASVF